MIKEKQKAKENRERYSRVKAEFQRLEGRDKNAYLSEHCREIEENNRMGKTRHFFKEIGDMKETFHAKMGTIKDKNSKDQTEENKKRWPEYTEVYRKGLNDLDNHDGYYLEPDILECEVKWVLGSITMSKTSGGDEFQLSYFRS